MIKVKRVIVEFEYGGEQFKESLTYEWLTGLENVTVAVEAPSDNGPTGDVEEFGLLDYLEMNAATRL